MNSDGIKQALAPCGLSCQECFAHRDGEIRHYSLKLREALGNFGDYAKHLETLLEEPVLKNYPPFKVMLDYLANENCRGCRTEACKLFKECGVRGCHREQQVDFCYQCEDFPCDRTNFDPALHQAWIKINAKIRKIGITQYAEQTRQWHRYP